VQPQDIYFVAGIFLPLLGLIGYFTARADGTAVWFPLLLICLGLVSLAYTWLMIGSLSFTGFADSILRILSAVI